MRQDSQERDWERLQEQLPGGPGDPCLDCSTDISCKDCRTEPREFYLEEE
jgi:hypothetical protein